MYQAQTGQNTTAQDRASGSVGKLYLVPTPLDFGLDSQSDVQDQLPLGTLQKAASITHWMCENAKSARAFLQRVQTIVPLKQALAAQQMWELPRSVHKKGDHAGSASKAANFAPAFLQAALDGHDLGLISEAGLPAVADPGSSVVAAAHHMGIPVVPLAGSSAIVLALAASGLHGQSFQFHGYLPQDAVARAQALQHLERLSVTGQGSSQIFMDTPYRNPALLSACLQHLQPHTQLAVCAGLLSAQPTIISRSIQNWHRSQAQTAVITQALHKIPTLFILQTVPTLNPARISRLPAKDGKRSGR